MGDAHSRAGNVGKESTCLSSQPHHPRRARSTIHETGLAHVFAPMINGPAEAPQLLFLTPLVTRFINTKDRVVTF